MANPAAAAVLVCGRGMGKPQSWAAVFIVCNAVVVNVLGTEAVSHRLPINEKQHHSVVRAHLAHHILPMVGALVLLGMWPSIAGRRGPNAVGGLAAMGALAYFWLETPSSSGATRLDKVVSVYSVDGAAAEFVSSAVLIAGACASLCVARVEIA